MKRIRLSIIGCSSFVHYHLAAIREEAPQFKFVGLADTSAKQIERVRAALPEKEASAPAFRDYKKMLAETKPDAVLVSTPHTLHFPHALGALQAGAHVMVEKPMVTRSAHARKLLAAAKKKKRILQIAVQGTYTDTFAYARKLLADGTVGRLQLVTGTLAQEWSHSMRGTWRQDPKLSGGGQLYDSCAHVLSAMMFLINSPVSEAFCWADNKGRRVDINAVATIRFRNGCLATVTSGGSCPAWYSHLVLQGDHAMLEIGPHGGNFRVSGGGLKKEITGVPKGWKIRTVSPARNFADSILGKDKPRCDGKFGLLLAELMDALYKSAATGRPVKVKRR